MSGNTGQLRKILELEDKKGYPDTTVIGGLDKYLKNWSAQVAIAGLNPSVLKESGLLIPPSPGYAALTPVQRQNWAKQTLNGLDKLESPSKTSSISEKSPVNPGKTLKPLKAIVKITKDTLTINKSVFKPSLDSPVILVKGINEVLQKRFLKLEVQTVRDLLYFFPNRHLDYSQRAYINNLSVGQENTIIANIWEAREIRLGNRRSAEATVGDETGNVRIVWFNQPYLAKSLKTGSRIVISGRVTVFGGMPVFESPEWEPYEEKDLVHTGRLVPVYPLTQGLSQRQVRRILKPAIDQWVGQLDEFLPDDLLKRLNFLNIQTLLKF